MGVEIDGLDEIIEQFEELGEKADDLSGEHEIEFEELFNEEFMESYTSFKNIDQLIEESQWEVESNEDFEDLPDDQFDKYISANTEFESWEDMLQIALNEWIAKKLGF